MKITADGTSGGNVGMVWGLVQLFPSVLEGFLQLATEILANEQKSHRYYTIGMRQ